jgi:fumarate hydratase subunit alpha/L(+)-tartrate dehydratase alpha subunit
MVLPRASGAALDAAIETACRDLYIRALMQFPPDVTAALERAAEQETSPIAANIMRTICENVRVAHERSLLHCQDTGIPVFFVKIGTEFPLAGLDVTDAIRRGTERATCEHPLRSSSTHTLTRRPTPTNTGERLPVIHYDLLPGADYLQILMIPKGSGSENMSFLKMLVPAAGIQGVKRFILECVVEAGANPCPPTIVGVGLGGSADLCMLLAKEAIARPVGSRNPDPMVAEMEEELLEAINATGIGPQGLGGRTTALAVHIEIAHTHITLNPVAVNLQCHSARRAASRLYADGRIEELALGVGKL